MHESAKRLHDFLYSDKKRYRAYHVSPLPNRLFSHGFTDYRKTIFPLGESQLEFIEENDEPKYFLWRTSPAKVKIAIKKGLIQYDALTSKIIYTLGQYYNSVNQRVYNHGIISNKHGLKIALIDYIQSNTEALQPLERWTNAPISDFEKSKSKILKTIKKYENTIKKNLITFNTSEKDFVKYDANIKVKNDTLLTSLLQRSASLKQKVLETNSKQALQLLCKPYNPEGIYQFIKKQSLFQLRTTQEWNQNISYSRDAISINRGDLHGYCEDALKVINDDCADLKNPILAEHQGDFNQKSDGKKAIVNFSYLGHHKKLAREALMTICQIDGIDKITQDKKTNIFYFQSNGNKSYPLKKTRFTKWAHNSPKQFLVSRILAWCWNISSGITIGLFYDLPMGILMGLSGQKIESLAENFYIKLTPPWLKGSGFQKLFTKLDLKKYSIGTTIGFKLINFTNNLWQDLFFGTSYTVDQYKIELWHNLISDYKIGHEINQDKALENLCDSILDIEKQYLKKLSKIKSKAPTEFKAFTYNQHQDVSAEQPYKLHDGEWLDILNSAVSGIRTIADTFCHNIHNKNPTLGLVFCTTYAFTALSILNPKLVSFLPKAFISQSQILGKALAKSQTMQAVGASSMQSQLLTAFIEGSQSGNTSWLATGGKAFENDPSNILVYSIMAISLGALIAFKLNIPFISKAIRDDLGTVPFPSLFFAGMKFGVLLVHLLEGRDKDINYHNHLKFRSILKQWITEYFKDNKKTNPPISETDLDAIISDLVSKNKLLKTENLTYSKAFEKQLFHILIDSKRLFLPYLSVEQKARLLNYTQSNWPDESSFHECLESILYPPKHQSIFIITMLTPLNYVPLLLRCAATPITLSKRPFIDLKKKCQKDLTRLYNAFANACHCITSVTKVLLKAAYEIIFHEILARGEGVIRNQNHQIAENSYALMRSLDESFESTKAKASRHLNRQKSLFQKPELLTLEQKIQVAQLESEAPETDQPLNIQSPPNLSL